jgi:hypothetical protein
MDTGGLDWIGSHTSRGTMRRSEPGHRVTVAIMASHGAGRWARIVLRKNAQMRMRWEDQELNHEVPENKFPEVFFAGLFLLGCTSKQRGSFLHIDQQRLDEMVGNGDLPEKAKGVRIDRLCLHYRLFCRLGPGGDHYPVLGTMHFWEDSKSLYAIFYLSPKNDWFHIMVVAGEAPNQPAAPNSGIGSQLLIGHHPPSVGEPERSP